MGTILSLRRNENDQFVVELLIDEVEALRLGGHTAGVHIITDRVRGIPARISRRGNKASTKYFLIPPKLRKGDSISELKEVSCQRILLPEKSLYVYAVTNENSGT